MPGINLPWLWGFFKPHWIHCANILWIILPHCKYFLDTIDTHFYLHTHYLFQGSSHPSIFSCSPSLEFFSVCPKIYDICFSIDLLVCMLLTCVRIHTHTPKIPARTNKQNQQSCWININIKKSVVFLYIKYLKRKLRQSHLQ